MRYRDWPEGRHIDDVFRGLNTLWVRLTQLSREKKSQLIAAIMNFTLLRFLISQRVPRTSPLRFTDILTSHRREPYVERNMYILKKRRCSVPLPCFHHLIPVHAIPIGGTVHMLQLLPEIYNYSYIRTEKDMSKRAHTNRRSGSDTISIRPIPALLRSILEVRVRGL